jgi:ABC-type uncharacterized transport system substrate-binding protein
MNRLRRQAIATLPSSMPCGELPAEIPMQLARQMRLAVNLRTARSMGIDLPESILVQADEVIDA